MKMRNSDYFMEEKIFTFREFQKISYTKNKKIFFKLKKYIKDNNLEDDYEFFKITKDAIVPQNFVGTIPLDDIQIEILSKIPLVENNIEAEKIRFLEILQSIDYFKEKIFSNSKIEITDTSILEIFIHLFIEEVEKIIKKGLIYRYVDKNENFNVFKGKLDINNHIKYNFSHKEKFFMKFDEFSVDSLENITIKLTIQKLKKISVNLKNKENLNKIGHYFENVSILDGSIENLKYLTFDRMNDYYKNAIQWAKIFLNNQSSSIFSTNNGEIPSILFPMETIFENYIANKLVNIIQEKSYNQLAIKVQDNSCSIFSSISLNNVKIDNNILRIRPDIVIKNKDAKEIFILDTKWKILNKLDDKFKISTEDVYQMLAYVKTYSDRNKNKYICKKAYLIYPATNMNQSTFFTKDDKLIFNTDDFELNIQFVDLSSEEGTEKSLINILNNFMKEGKRI
ncbi:McrC family protein [Fusobacterium animalis]|uniref:McrC family protein n=2 Tax=Fusobacteriaceae TaxID=203492 RepID=UPI001F312E2A|nr:McrC family protein [Fusobacterium animalis]